jgi:hypothetical protein
MLTNISWKLAKVLVKPSLAISRKLRERQVQRIPRTPLAKEHIQNCSLLLNRKELLEKLPWNGVVAEIGVDQGEFTSEILTITAPEKLHLVDIWGSNRYHAGLLDSVQSRFRNEIQSDKVKIHRNLSLAAAETFEAETFDWIYIDTDHTYETTWQELIHYAPKIKQNGLIAGHDYSMGNWISGNRYGVIEAVHKFCVEHDWELVYLTSEPIESQSFAIRRIADTEA